MADENKIPNQAKQLVQELKDVVTLQGDFRDILKDSIKELNKTLTSYEKIRATVSSLSKSTINIRDIEKNISKNAKDSYSTKVKMADLENKLSTSQKQSAENFNKKITEIQKKEAEILKLKNAGNISGARIYSRQLDALQRNLETQKSTLNLEELAYAQTLQSQKLFMDTAEYLKDQLNSEKEIQKMIGKTGQFIGFMNKKFGLFKDTYAKIVEEARDGNTAEITKIKLYAALIASLGVMYKMVKAIGREMGNMTLSAIKSLGSDGDGPISKLTSGLTNLIKTIPIVGPLLGGLAEAFTTILDIVIGINNQIIKAGRNLGLSAVEATKLYRTYANIAYQTGDIFITSKKMLDSQVELGQALEVNNLLSTETLNTNIKLKDILGLEAGLRADIVENAKISGQSEKDLVSTIAAQVKGLKATTGISLNFQKILGEANKLGGYLGLAFAKYPDKISKALVTTKALGTSLKEMDSIADSFLDFESSISKQFEAQLLTGKDINLQEARRLFLNNDLAGAALEINKQLGSSDEFLHMNRISAASMAESFGMSRDQLGEMLKRQELLSRLGAKDTDNARTQLKLGLERYQTQKALSAALGEDVYNNLVNASTQEKMVAFLDKIKTSIVDFIEGSGLIEKVEKFMNYLADPKNIKSILSKIKEFVADAIEIMGSIAHAILNTFDILTFGSIDNKLIDSISTGSKNMAERVRSVGAEPVTVSNSAARNQILQGSISAIATTPSLNKKNESVIVNVQNYTMLDSQNLAASNFKNAQSNAHLDNSVGLYNTNTNYSISGK